MGHDLIAAWFWGGKELFFETAKAEARKLDADQQSDYWETATGERAVDNHDDIINAIVGELEELESCIAHNSRGLLVFESPSGDFCYFGGGTSAGDDPCEEFTLINNLSALPTVLAALTGSGVN